MKTLLALFLPLLFVAPVVADEVQAIALPRATLADLASRPLADPGPRRIVHRLLPPLRPSLAGNAYQTGAAAPAASIEPPPLVLAFDSSTSRNLSPADASGAVGPNHVVGAYNSGLVVHDRQGHVLASLTLPQFWASSVGNTGFIYDPRIAYDTTADRWIVISIYDERAVYVAFSETGDPTAAWRRYSVAVNDVDFSQLALTRDTVMIGTNVGFEQQGVILTVQKEALYAAPPSLTLQRLDFFGGSDIVPVPSESSTTEYFVTSGGSQILFKSIDTIGQSWRVVTAPTNWQGPSWELPQPGAGPLDAGIPTIAAAMESGGSIYVTMTRTAPGASRQSIVWCKFDPVTLESEWGSVSDPAGAVAYAYPSLAVNRGGAMLIGFGSFSSTQYASSNYVYRDFLGRVSTVGHIRTGSSTFTATERWGDYTTTVVDPRDQNAFWSVQMHAAKGTWVTTWAKIEAVPSIGRRRTVRK
jgi:hypothetical protein